MASNPRLLRRERAVLVAPLLVVALATPGCAVVSVAGAAVSVTGAAVGGAVSVGSAVVGSTVKVAGKAVEKTIDAVAGGPAK
jgi:predicted small secreted protein